MRLSTLRAITCVGCIVCGIVTSRAGVAVLAQHDEQSIRQMVQTNGAFERITVTTENQMQLGDLVRRADLIVEATNAGSRMYFSEADNGIYSDYTFKVGTVIKNWRRLGLRTGNDIIVRRESGFVLVDGKPAYAAENEFPPFGAKESYVLFLSERPREGAYSVLGGPKGAFTAGENISPIMLQLGVALAQPPSTPRAEFLGDVRALLKFSEQ